MFIHGSSVNKNVNIPNLKLSKDNVLTHVYSVNKKNISLLNKIPGDNRVIYVSYVNKEIN